MTVELAIVPSVRLGSWSTPRARGMTNDVAYRGTGPGAMVGSGGLGGGGGAGGGAQGAPKAVPVTATNCWDMPGGVTPHIRKLEERLRSFRAAVRADQEAGIEAVRLLEDRSRLESVDSVYQAAGSAPVTPERCEALRYESVESVDQAEGNEPVTPALLLASRVLRLDKADHGVGNAPVTDGREETLR